MIHSLELQTELEQAREMLAQGAESMVELRPLPAIAVRVDEACKNQNLDARSLAKLVECDPAFASKTLSVVNSSMYGFSRDVSSIQQAIVVLGRKHVSQLAISIAAQKVFSTGDAASQARLSLYEHSLGCASICRTLASQMNGEVDSEAAFLAGMLHDVGKLIFLDVAPNTYPTFFEQNQVNNSVTMELESFGTDHTQLGVMFGDAWNLAPPIREAIASHHDEEPLGELTQVVVYSNQLARMWGIGQTIESPDDCERTIDWLNSSVPMGAEEIRTQATAQFNELKALLAS